MNAQEFLAAVKGKLIVSCQALPDEPLHGSSIMAKLAAAAKIGGACGIRANSPADIRAIKQAVDLPVIGLNKRGESGVYITPTFQDAAAIASAGADVIALDCTQRARPDGVDIRDLLPRIKDELRQPIFADVACLDDAILAAELGADMAGPTLAGYIGERPMSDGPDFDLLARMIKRLPIPVIAEGRITTPAQARQALDLGAWAVVVGSAITRPRSITARFVSAIEEPSDQAAQPKQTKGAAMKTLAFLGVAHIHTPGFARAINERADEFTVAAVWDSQAERAAIAAGHLKSAAVDDYRAILADDAIDAIIICSETSLHAELAIATAEAGKALFVEKPLGMRAEDAYAIQAAIDAAGVIFQTGHFMRSMPVYRALKRFIDDGSLGTITRIRHSNVHQGALAAIFDPGGRGWYPDGWMWMTDAALSGCGGFGDLGAHSLDILMWLMGDVESVTAQVDRLLGKYDCDEYGEGMLRFANGAIGTLAAGWVDVLRPQPILVSGTAGVAYVDDDKLYVQSENLTGADGGEWTDLPEALPHAFALFLDAVNGADAELISAKEAADRTAVMAAFYQAAETNAWVKPQTA